MTFSVQETLFSLLRLNGISGHESSIANVMQHAFEQQAKDVWRDRLGNVVARYGSDKSDALRLMIFAHMDEVGFMVRKIEPSGFLRFERVGGPAQITMPGSIVTLAGRSGDIMGCIGIKAYHFAKGDERTQPPALDKLWIDIGAKDKADAERMGIQVGTPEPFTTRRTVWATTWYAVRRWMTGWGVRRYWASPRPSPPHRSISRYSWSRRCRKSSIFAALFPFYDACAPTWRLVLISPHPATRLTCRITLMCGSTTASASPV